MEIISEIFVTFGYLAAGVGAGYLYAQYVKRLRRKDEKRYGTGD